MTFGYRIWRDDQSVVADNTYRGGVFVEILDIPAGQSGSKTYPTMVGAPYFLVLKGGNHGLGVSANGLGEGVLTWVAASDPGSNTIVAVFAKDVLQSDEYAVAVYGDDNAIAISGDHKVPQFLGTVQPAAAPVESVSIPNGQVRHTHRVASGAVGSASMLVFVLCALPDTSGTATWYAWTPWMYGTGKDLDLYVYADPGAAYTVPTLHLYNVNMPPEPGDLIGVQTYDSSGDRVWVASERNMAVTEDFTFNFPPQDASTSYTVAMPTNAGIFLPEYRFEGFVAGSYVQWYQGVVKRAGGQLTFGMIKYAEQVVVAGEPVPRLVAGNKNGNHGIIVDLLHYGAGATPGSPGSVLSAPVFTSHPSPSTVQEGAQYSFTAAVTGNPAPTLQWYKGASPISGATSATYTGTATAADNGVQFKCYASNSQGNVYSNPATLTVQVVVDPPPDGDPPTIYQNPTDVTVEKNQTASFSVGVSGATSGQWYRNGSAVLGATSSSINANTSTSGSFTYHYVASNEWGDTPSGTATLTVTEPVVYPTITQDPPATKTTTVGQAVAFSANGYNYTSVQWFRNGVAYGGNDLTCYPTVNTTADSGVVYFCRFYNGSVYSDTTGCTVYVNPAPAEPPIISVQPPTTKFAFQFATGVTISVSVSNATADNDTNYQWFRDSGAGFVHIYSGRVLTIDTGTVGVFPHYCMVGNIHGTTDSDVCYVTIEQQ